MKKLILTMAAIATIYGANAWETPGVLVYSAPHNSTCNPSSGICQKSMDPYDPSPSVGDRIEYLDNTGHTVRGTIIAIETLSQQTPPPPVGITYVKLNNVLFKVAYAQQ